MQSIHPQLQEDCHVLGASGNGTILLHRNALVPWLLIVPAAETDDLCMLESTAYHQLMSEVRTMASFIKSHFKCERINIASIGNIVPQLHIHIVGRQQEDACWPLPVWGNLSTATTYADMQIVKIMNALRDDGILRSGTPS